MILNLTQHPATPEQRAAGVFDTIGNVSEHLRIELTFDAIPAKGEINARAAAIAWLAEVTIERTPRAERRAMIGGAPYLMAALEGALRMRGIEPLYAFSVRESAEVAQPDGSVRKVAVFKHAGFVSAGGAL